MALRRKYWQCGAIPQGLNISVGICLLVAAWREDRYFALFPRLPRLMLRLRRIDDVLF